MTAPPGVVLPDFRQPGPPANSTTMVQFVRRRRHVRRMNMLHGQVEVVDALEAAQLDLSAGSPGGMESRPGALRSGQVEEDQAREASRRNRRPAASGRRRGDPHPAGAGRHDGPRAVHGGNGCRAPAEPVGAVRAHHPGDVLHRVARAPDRLAGTVASHRRHEHPDHTGHVSRLRVQRRRHDRSRPAARGRAGGVLRGGRRDHHADPARPAVEARRRPAPARRSGP